MTTACPPVFPRYLVGQTASFLAYQMLMVAVGWQIYDLTQSALVLGLVGLVQFLPQLLLTLVAGHVADRHSRRAIIATCQLLACGLALSLALGSWSGLLAAGHILACSCLVGVCRTFEMPTNQAFIPTLVPVEELPRCLALTAGGRQLAVILGPALGGLIYVAGPQVVYATCAGFYALAWALTLSIPRPAAPAHRPPASLRTMLEGLTFIRSKPDILGAISLDLFSVLLGGATALLPIFARDILHTGPWGLGLLRAAPAGGALLVSTLLARWPLRHQVGRKLFLSVACFGLATIGFGLSTSFWLSLACLMTLGAADMVSVVIRSSLVQLETPDAKRGRVSAINSIFIGASNQLGEFESGVTAAWLGTVPAVVVGGVCTLLVVVVWMRLFPGLRQRDRLVADSSA